MKPKYEALIFNITFYGQGFHLQHRRKFGREHRFTIEADRYGPFEDHNEAVAHIVLSITTSNPELEEMLIWLRKASIMEYAFIKSVAAQLGYNLDNLIGQR